MMKSLGLMIGMTAAVAACATASERSVKMKDLPPAVQQTVQEKTKGLTLLGLSEETDKGQTFYEAETKAADGKTRDILIDANGAVVELEEEIPLASIPEAARAAIERAAGNARVDLVEAVTKGGTTVYEAHVKKNGKKTEIVVAADGTLQEKH